MKYKYMIVPVLMSLLLCACSFKDSGTNTAKEGEMMEVETSEPARVIGPVIEPTWETQLKGATDTYNNVCDSYAKMQELANSDTATKKGKKAAAKVEKKYAKRIEELSTVPGRPPPPASVPSAACAPAPTPVAPGDALAAGLAEAARPARSPAAAAAARAPPPAPRAAGAP